MVRRLAVLRDLPRAARIHEQGGDEDDESAGEKHTDVRRKEGPIAIGLVHFEDQEDLLVSKLVKLGELLAETGNILVPYVLFHVSVLLKVELGELSLLHVSLLFDTCHKLLFLLLIHMVLRLGASHLI